MAFSNLAPRLSPPSPPPALLGLEAVPQPARASPTPASTVRCHTRMFVSLIWVEERLFPFGADARTRRGMDFLPRPFPSMLIRRHPSGLVVHTPAKVNLHLEVLRRRDDGYHDLATLMVAVNLYDTLEFTEDPSGAVRLQCDHDKLSAGPDNLVCRPPEPGRRRAGHAAAVTIRLPKPIPL